MIVHETSPTRVWTADPTSLSPDEPSPGSLEFNSHDDGDRYVLVVTPRGQRCKVDIGFPNAGYSACAGVHECLGSIARQIRHSLAPQQELPLVTQQEPSAGVSMHSQRGGILSVRIVDTSHALLGIVNASGRYPYTREDAVEVELRIDGSQALHTDLLSFGLTPSVFALIGSTQQAIQRLVAAHPDFARDIPGEFFPNISRA